MRPILLGLVVLWFAQTMAETEPTDSVTAVSKMVTIAKETTSLVNPVTTKQLLLPTTPPEVTVTTSQPLPPTTPAETTKSSLTIPTTTGQSNASLLDPEAGHKPSAQRKNVAEEHPPDEGLSTISIFFIVLISATVAVIIAITLSVLYFERNARKRQMRLNRTLSSSSTSENLPSLPRQTSSTENEPLVPLIPPSNPPAEAKPAAAAPLEAPKPAPEPAKPAALPAQEKKEKDDVIPAATKPIVEKKPAVENTAEQPISENETQLTNGGTEAEQTGNERDFTQDIAVSLPEESAMGATATATADTTVAAGAATAPIRRPKTRTRGGQTRTRTRTREASVSKDPMTELSALNTIHATTASINLDPTAATQTEEPREFKV